MDKLEVIKLARELFKIRLSSSREGAAEDDGVHKMGLGGIKAYTNTVIQTWYQEALATAEIIIALETTYQNS